MPLQKPFRIGPIAPVSHNGCTLVIPVFLQGDWAITSRDDIDMLDEAEERLSKKAGSIADAIERHLVARGELSQTDVETFNTPVVLEASSDENLLSIKVHCKSANEAAGLADFVKSHALMSDVELVVPRVLRRPPNPPFAGK